MFVSKYKKNNVYPCKPQFYCIKEAFKGHYYMAYFRDGVLVYANSEEPDHPAQSAARIIGYYRMNQWRANAWIRLRMYRMM